MNGRDFAIGILSVTAVVLIAALVIVQSVAPAPVMAGQSAAAGEYIAATATLDEVSDLLIVIDTSTQKMNYYTFDAITNTLQPVTQIDLKAQAGRRRAR